VNVRVAGAADVAALAALRARWSAGMDADTGFEQRMAAWLADEGNRRTTWLATAADERGYARLVLSPSARSVPFYERAGFVVPDERAGDHRLLVRARSG
jgi:hypothetical protein